MFESMTLFLPSVTGIHALVPHPVLPSEALDVLRVALNVLVPGGAPFATYSELRNESWVQLHHEGNLRLAGLATGVCGEVFLDTVLLHLLWEVGATPEEAARVFERNRHKARVLAQYHEKLGGCWTDKGDGPIASYLQRVVNLRNRIAHGGHEPSAGDVESAQDAMMSLESFVAERVLENVARYPLTAFSLFGIDGLRSRGRYSRKTEAAIQSRAPLDWEGAFARWRYHFARVRGNGVDPGATPESLNLVWARYPDGSVRWFVHDRDARMASAVDGKAMVPEEVVRTLDELRVALEKENPPHPIYTDVRVEPTRLAEAAGNWVPEYELIPELSIQVPGW